MKPAPTPPDPAGVPAPDRARHRRNRLGTLSLIGAALGFGLANFVPWPLIGSLSVLPGLSLRALLVAFFDASLVGAFADWFAVTALFRHPLGLRLPHTNVIARNKDSVAEAVPRFLTGFVSTDAIGRELAGIDFAALLEQAIRASGQREELHRFLRSRLGTLAGAEATRREADELVRGLLGLLAGEVDLAEAGATVVGWARGSRFTERLIEGGASLVLAEMDRHHDDLVLYLTRKLKRSAGWQAIFIGQGTSEKILAAIAGELDGLRSDPAHEIRRFLFAALDSWAMRLRRPGPDREKFESLVRGALANPDFVDQSIRFAQELLLRMGEDLQRPDSRFVGTLERLEDQVLARIGSDPDFRAAFNRGLAGILADLIDRSRLVGTMAGYLAVQMKRTDTAAFVRQVEGAVWNDLQYIRVNGAVVGGLAGLALALLQALAGH
jgi:uncharacterized membrane-anchored protein YjiN (DUF445 family)